MKKHVFPNSVSHCFPTLFGPRDWSYRTRSRSYWTCSLVTWNMFSWISETVGTPIADIQLFPPWPTCSHFPQRLAFSVCPLVTGSADRVNRYWLFFSDIFFEIWTPDCVLCMWEETTYILQRLALTFTPPFLREITDGTLSRVRFFSVLASLLEDQLRRQPGLRTINRQYSSSGKIQQRPWICTDTTLETAWIQPCDRTLFQLSENPKKIQMRSEHSFNPDKSGSNM